MRGEVRLAEKRAFEECFEAFEFVEELDLGRGRRGVDRAGKERDGSRNPFPTPDGVRRIGAFRGIHGIDRPFEDPARFVRNFPGRIHLRPLVHHVAKKRHEAGFRKRSNPSGQHRGASGFAATQIAQRSRRDVKRVASVAVFENGGKAVDAQHRAQRSVGVDDHGNAAVRKTPAVGFDP